MVTLLTKVQWLVLSIILLLAVFTGTLLLVYYLNLAKLQDPRPIDHFEQEDARTKQMFIDMKVEEVFSLY